MTLAKNPDIAKWQCGRCNTWNDIEHGTCKKCKSPAALFASAFRLRNMLAPEEKMYYETLFPMLLTEVRDIRRLLEQVVDIVEVSDGQNDK